MLLLRMKLSAPAVNGGVIQVGKAQSVSTIRCGVSAATTVDRNASALCLKTVGSVACVESGIQDRHQRLCDRR